jgi:metallophosphoesterase superfamily enzyme
MTRPRLSGNRLKAFEYLTSDENRIMVVGDLHCPFDHPRALKHAQETYAKFNCNKVIFIGDVLDSSANSFHESDPNGMSAGDELYQAKKHVAKWYKAFPKATVIIGNHDLIVARKAFSGGIPREWIKHYNDVLDTPNWVWTERLVIDDMQFVHGQGGTARTKAKSDLMSTIQGHIHTQMYVEHFSGVNSKIWACQVGCLVNRESYALHYAKNFKRQALGVAVILGNHTCINVPMELGKKKIPANKPSVL